MVRRFAGKLMTSGRPAIAAVGPAGKFERYETFAARFATHSALVAAE